MLWDKKTAERWDLIALASVLDCRVHSIYPNVSNDDIQGQNNNVSYTPRVRQDLDNLPSIRILWSHGIWHEEIPDQRIWRANHFVPLLTNQSLNVISPNAFIKDSTQKKTFFSQATVCSQFANAKAATQTTSKIAVSTVSRFEKMVYNKGFYTE
jgi:hypothetical protein